ncbi:MAG: hypothetical protein QM765_44335 [Myxococcales bacterium]
MPEKKTAAKMPPPVKVTPELLRKLAKGVLRESAAGGVRSTLTIGRNLFMELFHSSAEAFRSMAGNKTDSLAALAAQKGMAEAGWGRTRLRNAIELVLLAKVLDNLRPWPTLRVSHYEEVFNLALEQQRALLDQAESETWSVVRLAQEAGKLCPPRKAARSATATATVSPDRVLGRVRKLMAELAPASPLTEILVQAGIDSAQAKEFEVALASAAEKLQGIQASLEELKKRSAHKLQRLAGKVAASG